MIPNYYGDLLILDDDIEFDNESVTDGVDNKGVKGDDGDDDDDDYHGSNHDDDDDDIIDVEGVSDDNDVDVETVSDDGDVDHSQVDEHHDDTDHDDDHDVDHDEDDIICMCNGSSFCVRVYVCVCTILVHMCVCAYKSYNVQVQEIHI